MNIQGLLRCAASAATLSAITPFPAAAKGDQDLAAAFNAAFAHASPLVRTWSGAEAVRHRDSLDTLRQETLVKLTDVHYALIAIDTDRDGAHATQGAVSIAYLTRDAKGFHLQRTWNLFEAFGNNGADGASVKIRTDLAANPIALLSDPFTAQGATTDMPQLIELAPEGPVARGFVDLGETLDDAFECNRAAERYSYVGDIVRSRDSDGAFEVRYRRWLAACDNDRPNLPIAKVTYRLENGVYQAQSDIVWPDGKGAVPRLETRN